MFDCLLRLGFEFIYFMPAAVGNLSYANCLRKRHVELFIVL
jgi:hypothetical protein